MNWFIEGDISQCFDKLSHELLLDTLRKHIHDGRFINLIRELLDAGYMEDWTYNQTYNGVPQGGVISPVLSNILLNKLDTFVETILVPKYTKGVERKENPEYRRLVVNSFLQRRRGNVERAEELKKQFQRLPSKIVEDPEFRRLKYVRYADDFLLGFIGPKSEAKEIKQQLTEFLQEELKLELSQAKTLITHGRSEAARFLGYEITVLQGNSKQTARSNTGASARSINGTIGLRVPKDVLKEKCERYKKDGKAIHRTELLENGDYTIIMTYQSEYRGITNYYRMAYNMTKLATLGRDMERSLVKTLASKHKTTVSQIYTKHRADIEIDGKKKRVLQASIRRKDKEPLVATWGGISLKWDIQATLEEQLPQIYGGRTELEQRLLAEICELCGATDKVEVHHVKAMKYLHEYPGREKPLWVKRMIALKRKTMPLCQPCHDDIHAGRPLRRQPIELEEVKARQKAKTAILESRMQ